MSRWLSWLSELQPEMFCEVSPALAAKKELTNGGWATISTARGEIECRVLVSERIPDLRIKGKIHHQIGLPYHWAGKGLVTGDVANELIGFVADPNVSIQESKALTGDIKAGRRSKKRRVVTTDSFVQEDDPDRDRDLPPAQEQADKHGTIAGESQSGEQT
jgi:formate dehydrogenase major subunit